MAHGDVQGVARAEVALRHPELILVIADAAPARSAVAVEQRAGDGVGIGLSFEL